MWRSPTVTYIWRVQSNPIPNLDFDRWRFCCSFQVISFYLLFFVKLQTSVKHTQLCSSWLHQWLGGEKKMHSHSNQTQKWMVQCPCLRLYPSLIWLLRLGIDSCLSSLPPPAASKPLVSFHRWIKTQTAAAPWWAPPAAASGSAVHAAAGFTLPGFPSFVFTGVPAAWWRHPLQGAALGRRHATAPAECCISRDANKRQIPYAASPNNFKCSFDENKGVFDLP